MRAGVGTGHAVQLHAHRCIHINTYIHTHIYILVHVHFHSLLSFRHLESGCKTVDQHYIPGLCSCPCAQPLPIPDALSLLPTCSCTSCDVDTVG